MFEVAEKYEECKELLDIDVHLQFWDNMTGSHGSHEIIRF